MFISFNRLLAPLNIPAQKTNRMLMLLNRMTLAIIGISIIHVFAVILILKRLDIAIYGLLAAVLCAVINLIARWGYVRLATSIFIGGIWLIISLPHFLLGGEGVYGAAFSAYIIPVLLAGFLLGGKTSFVVAFVSLLAGIFYTFKVIHLPQYTLT